MRQRISEKNIFPSFDLFDEYQKLEEIFQIGELLVPMIDGGLGDHPSILLRNISEIFSLKVGICAGLLSICRK